MWGRSRPHRHPMQLLPQLYGVGATALWCELATYGLLLLVGAIFPLRASPEDEMGGSTSRCTAKRFSDCISI